MSEKKHDKSKKETRYDKSETFIGEKHPAVEIEFEESTFIEKNRGMSQTSTGEAANVCGYDVILGADLFMVVSEVKSRIIKGYRPMGGISYCPKMGIWYQAVAIF